jgi:hypothetical protein
MAALQASVDALAGQGMAPAKPAAAKRKPAARKPKAAQKS